MVQPLAAVAPGHERARAGPRHGVATRQRDEAQDGALAHPGVAQDQDTLLPQQPVEGDFVPQVHVCEGLNRAVVAGERRTLFVLAVGTNVLGEHLGPSFVVDLGSRLGFERRRHGQIEEIQLRRMGAAPNAVEPLEIHAPQGGILGQLRPILAKGFALSALIGLRKVFAGGP